MAHGDDIREAIREGRETGRVVYDELAPTRKTFFKGLGYGLLIIIALTTGTRFIGWWGEAATVVREEFGPRVLFQRYTWLKDAAAQLDRKQADIRMFKGRVSAMEVSYGPVPRRNWDRVDRQTHNQWIQETAGVISSYNNLAAQYNAAMAKVNWRFTEVGMLPPGAITPLPRQYKPYEETL